MGKRNAVVSISAPAQLQGSSLGDTLCVSSSLHFQPVPSPWVGTAAGSDPSLCSQPGGV